MSTLPTAAEHTAGPPLKGPPPMEVQALQPPQYHFTHISSLPTSLATTSMWPSPQCAVAGSEAIGLSSSRSQGTHRVPSKATCHREPSVPRPKMSTFPGPVEQTAGPEV